MLPRVYRKISEKFFKDKNLAKSYLLEVGSDKRGGSAVLTPEAIKSLDGESNKKNTYYLYEIQIKLDLENVINSKIRNFKVYLTNADSEQSFQNQLYSNPIDRIVSLNETPENSVGNLMAMEGLDITSTLINTNENKNHALTNIDPKSFIDLARYKQNFKGTSSDKFGLISNINSYITKTILAPSEKYNNIDSTTTIFASQEKINRRIETGLYSGIPIVETMELDRLVRSNTKKVNKAWGRRQKVKRSDQKNSSTYTDDKTRDNLIPGFKESLSTRKIETTGRKSSSATRNVTFDLKIKHSDLIKNTITKNEFGIILEAEDKNNLIIDRQFVKINLEKDVKYHLVSFGDIELSASSNDIFTKISILNLRSNNMQLKMHQKVLKRNVAFYDHNFTNNVLTKELQGSKSSSITLNNKASTSNSQQNASNSIFGVNSFSSPMFFRFTPTIQSMEFDNFLEIGLAPSSHFENAFVPFVVKSIVIEGRICAQIDIYTSKIPSRYKRLKIFKKDRNQSLFGNYSDNLKSAFDENGNLIAPLPLNNNFKVNNGNIITAIDYNVEPGRLYDYRLELFEGVKRSGRKFSASFFQEKIETRDEVAIFSNVGSPVRAGNTFFVKLKCKIIETDAEKSFKSLLGNKYDLFKSEINQVKDITTNSIVAKVERICITDCTVKTVGYFPPTDGNNNRSESGNTNTNEALFNISDSGLINEKEYEYKVTPCLKPVAELISGINEEIVKRTFAGKRKNVNQTKHAAFKRIIQNLNDNILYSLSTKLSNQKAGKIIDPETMADINSNNAFSSASTGDITYYKARRVSSIQNLSETNESGSEEALIKEYTHINTVSRIIKSKNSLGFRNYKNKIILEFSCKITNDVDHAVLFLNNNGIVDYCCNMHTRKDKTNYRLLIEKENLKGDVSFLLYPVNKKGKIHEPTIIDTIKL